LLGGSGEEKGKKGGEALLNGKGKNWGRGNQRKGAEVFSLARGGGKERKETCNLFVYRRKKKKGKGEARRGQPAALEISARTTGKEKKGKKLMPELQDDDKLIKRESPADGEKSSALFKGGESGGVGKRGAENILGRGEKRKKTTTDGEEKRERFAKG